MENKPKINEKAFVREVWLNLFNDFLLDNGYITAEEHRKMTLKISTETGKRQG